MKTKAVRLYGEMDLRLDEFELPEMQDDEIMAEVVTDSLCMSSYKAITQAQKHKKVPNDISEKNDVAKQHPGIVKRLSKELGNYLRATGGQRPTFKATGKPCPWPDEI